MTLADQRAMLDVDGAFHSKFQANWTRTGNMSFIFILGMLFETRINEPVHISSIISGSNPDGTFLPFTVRHAFKPC